MHGLAYAIAGSELFTFPVGMKDHVDSLGGWVIPSL